MANVLNRHFVVFAGHKPRFVVLFTCNLPHHLEEGWQFLRSALHSCLYSEDRRERFNVKERFKHEILGLVDEALLDLFNVSLAVVSALQELDVLTSSDLSFLLNLVSIEREAHFVRIGVRVILANFV